MKLKIPLFLKFAIIMIAIVVTPLVFVGIKTVNINRDALQGAILELHTQLANSYSEKVDFYLREIQNEIPYITKIFSAREVSYETIDAVLRTVVDTHENIVSISLLDSSGKERRKVYNPKFIHEPKLLDLKTHQTFKQLKQSKLGYAISKLYYSDKEKTDPRLDLFFKINPNITVHIIVTLNKLWDELYKIHIGKTGFAFLIDNTGKIIAHKDKQVIFTKPKDISIIDTAIGAVSFGSSEYKDAKGVELVSSYAPIKILNWSIIVQQQKKEAYYSSIVMRRQAVYLIVLSTVLGAIIAFILARNLTKPILALIKAAGKIAQRDFTAKVNLKTNDELNDLIRTFNNMTIELKKYDDMQIDKILAEKTKTEAIIFSIADGIMMTNHKGEILLLNRQARNILNIGDESLEGKILWDYIPHKYLKEALSELMNIPKDTDKVKFAEVDMSSNNITKFFKASTNPVTTPKGENLGVLTVLRDITLEKEIDRMKDDFLHSITHDLRNPMTSIRGFLKFLKDGIGGPLNEQQKRMIETMDRASIRLLGMINDILDLAKLESGRMELQLVSCDLLQIVNRVMELLEPQITKKSIKAKVELLNGQKEALLNCDPQLIERLVNNLVGNAIKFTPENGTISVLISDMQDRVEAKVIDTGEGIPPEYLTTIFDKFKQVTGKRKGGTGLGLTVCKYIVEAHKGKIWVESKLNEGSKFSFYIPKNLKLSPNGEIIYENKLQSL